MLWLNISFWVLLAACLVWEVFCAIRLNRYLHGKSGDETEDELRETSRELGETDRVLLRKLYACLLPLLAAVALACFYGLLRPFFA